MPPVVPRPALVAVVLGLGAAINPINSSLVIGSFTDIAQEFGITFADVSTLMTYYLAFTAALYPIAGAVGDRLGRRRVFLLGIAGFCVVSLLASWAPNFAVLLLCRCLQALFSAALMPNASALLRDLVPEAKLAGAVGLFAGIVGSATALGFPLGGLLSQSFGWRPLFWVNVPLSLCALVAALCLLPADRPRESLFSLVALFGVPLLPLALGVNLWFAPASRAGVTAALLIGMSVLLSAGLMIAVWRLPSLRGEVARFCNRGYGIALIVSAFYSVVMYGVFLLLPAWMLGGLGMEKREAGLYLGLITVSLAFGAPVAGQCVQRFGERACLLSSALMMAFGLGLFRQISEFDQLALVAGCMLMGFSFTGIGNATQTTALKWVPEEVTAMAMGLSTSARYLGGLVGTTAVAYLIGARQQVDLAAGQLAFDTMALVAIGPLILCALLLPMAPQKALSSA